MYAAICPACSRTVAGGDVCECGYLYVDGGGRAYSRRGEGWENAPNIAPHLVTLEEEPEELAFIDEPPPKLKKDD
jgi:hypothetical protein